MKKLQYTGLSETKEGVYNLQAENRYKWVDVSKAIAMIFVYLGHWITEYLGHFAYAFHLQLFFLAAGFFAVRTSKREAKEWVSRQFHCLLLPYLVWVLISFCIKNIDNTEFSNTYFYTIITNAKEMQPNYWFFPAFIAVSTTYYLLYKVTKRPVIVFIISVFMHFLLGEVSVIPVEYNVFNNVESWPSILKIINNWFGIASVPQWLFWYSLGAIVFRKVEVFLDMKKMRPLLFYLMGGGLSIFSMFLFFKKITEIKSISNIIYANNFTQESYRICCSLIILCFIFFISKLMEDSDTLNNIGKSSMNFMGLEYITHGFWALSYLPMINLGIPNVSSTIDVVTAIFIQMAINLWISNRINKYVPVLNGDWSKQIMH